MTDFTRLARLMKHARPRWAASRRVLIAMLALLPGALIAAPAAVAQVDSPVYIDDSPQAWELFRQAKDQQRNNLGECLRLCQEVLDDFTYKLIPVNEKTTELHRSARLRVLEYLVSDEELLARYRSSQTAAAQAMLDAGEIEKLALTRSLTEPGLDALLMLAQGHIEAARFDAALGLLDEASRHPDFAGRRAASAHSMRGFIASVRGDREAFQAAQTALTLLGAQADAQRAALEQLDPNDRPETPPMITALGRGQAAHLDDVVAQAIWSAPLDDSLLRRRMAFGGDVDQAPAALAETRSRQADLTTAAPTVVGSNVYINQGHTVLCLNLLTGREQWRFTDSAQFLRPPDRDNQEALDLNMVAVGDDSVVTLTGYAMSTSRGDGGRIVCLEAATGSLRWGPMLDAAVGAGPEDEAFPHGAPIIAEGSVFVAVRKVSNQMLTSAYVVCLDLDTGAVRWVRHIASSGGLQRGTRPFCSLVYDRGSIFMGSAVGAAACLDAATGQIRWLHRFSVPMSASVIDQSRRPWEMTGPVLTPGGVMMIQPDSRRVALLDRQTGDLLDSKPCGMTAAWNSPRYLLADDRHVFAVGTEIHAFTFDDLERPAWKLPTPLRQSIDPKAPGAAAAADAQGPIAIDIRGRVQLLEDSLLVPTAEGLLLVDANSGHVTNTYAVQATGNPLAVDAQLLLASGDRLDSFMSFDHAQAMLRQRIEQAPGEPEPALSLLRLAMRVKDFDLAVEAADLSLKAVNTLAAADPGDKRARETRAELFSLLLEAAGAKIARNDEQGERLFATISNVAVEPEQKVRHQLAYGDWLTDHALNRAVESYQAILTDPILADSWQTDRGDLSRPASFLAADRLAAVIARDGPEAYAPQADFAARRLPLLAAAKNPEPQALTRLATNYPFSAAAIDAALQAASIRQRAGDPRGAIAGLVRIHQLAPREETVTRLLGAAVDIAQQASWLQTARDLLQEIDREHPKSKLVATDGQRTAADWLAMLKPENTRREARIGSNPGTAEPLSGVPVPPYDRESSLLPADRLLIRDGKSLQLLSAASLKPMWKEPAAGEADVPELLRFGDTGILLWYGADALDPKAVMLDAVSGQTVWTTPRVADLLADPVRDLAKARGVRDQMPNGDPFDPQQTLPLVSDRALILIQRTGGIAAYGLHDGKTVLWSRKQSLEQVHFAALSDGVLALSGMARDARGANAAPGPGELAPRIMLIDPATGNALCDPIAPMGRLGVKWMELTPQGSLVYGTSEGIEAADASDGRRLFASVGYDAVETQRALQIGGRLIVVDGRTRLHSLDTLTGRLSEAFETPARGEWNPTDLRRCIAVGSRLAACFPQRVVVYNPANGTIAGNDVIENDRDFRHLLGASSPTRMVLVNNIGVTQEAALGGGLRTQYNYTLFVLSDNARIESGPLGPVALPERITVATLLDGWVILGTNSATLAVPMTDAK